MNDLKKLLVEFDSAAAACYKQGLENLQNFDKTLEKLNVAHEYDWFQKRKVPVTTTSLLYNFESVDDDVVIIYNFSEYIYIYFIIGSCNFFVRRSERECFEEIAKFN